MTTPQPSIPPNAASTTGHTMLAQVNDALERTRTGQARFRTVLLPRQ